MTTLDYSVYTKQNIMNDRYSNRSTKRLLAPIVVYYILLKIYTKIKVVRPELFVTTKKTVIRAHYF